MKIVSIYYEKVFPIAAYQNEKIGIEIQVDPEDDFDSAYKFAKAKVEEWAKQKVESAMSCSGYEIPIDKPHTDDIPVIQIKLDHRIINAKTLEELALLKEEATQSGSTRLYMARAQQLSHNGLQHS